MCMRCLRCGGCCTWDQWCCRWGESKHSTPTLQHAVSCHSHAATLVPKNRVSCHQPAGSIYAARAFNVSYHLINLDTGSQVRHQVRACGLWLPKASAGSPHGAAHAVKLPTTCCRYGISRAGAAFCGEMRNIVFAKVRRRFFFMVYVFSMYQAGVSAGPALTSQLPPPSHSKGAATFFQYVTRGGVCGPTCYEWSSRPACRTLQHVTCIT